VDVDTKDNPHKVAAHLLAELTDRTGPTVVGWTNGTRMTPLVVEAPLPSAPPLDIGPDAVVLLTGGGRGITAHVAVGLAEATGCRIELVGRTPLPAAHEDPTTAGAADEVALRQAVIAQGVRVPAEVERTVRRILADRQVRATLAALASSAASVRYHCAADRFLRDKTDESFAEVFATKIDGAKALAAALRPGTRFLALFGSVAGVFGNVGQTDYAAANDALDTLAPVWQHQLGGTRVVAIDWGPWSSSGGGMVTPALESELTRRGVATIDPAAGVRALLEELAAVDGHSQVIRTIGLGLSGS
jgi:NAD(P)-dependent dehydrogenase (short-subunit alcohol dehydrogenase family)